jgi:hypothetical protein
VLGGQLPRPPRRTRRETEAVLERGRTGVSAS